MHHLTLLATAWYLTRDERYAERVAAQLRSWWQDNPFLSGVHWTSGIEIGIRLISLAWIRRLLDDWPPVERAVRAQRRWRVAQIRWHQQYLAGVPQPRLVGQQPRDRRGRGPARGGLRVPLVPRERALAARGRARCSSRSWTTTRSRPASAASWPPTTSASWPSSGWSRRSRRRPAGIR